MSTHDDIAWLGGWEGHEVGGVEREDGEHPEIWIHLTPAPMREMICTGCGVRRARAGAARWAHTRWARLGTAPSRQGR